MINIAHLVAAVCIDSDPLVAAVIAETGNCYSDGPPCVDDLRAEAARLSAVLAAAREIVRQDDESSERCNVDMRLLRDALAAADAAIAPEKP